MKENIDQPSNCPEKDIKPLARHLANKLEEKHPDIFKNIPNKEEIIEDVLSVYVHEETEYEETHSGPLPSPETLKEYNEIIKDGGERIMKVFENQSSHRIKLEKRVVGRQTFQSLLGQIFGFIIAITFLLGGLFLVINKHDGAGITMFSLDVVGLVYIFVVGKKFQHKSLKENE